MKAAVTTVSHVLSNTYTKRILSRAGYSYTVETRKWEYYNRRLCKKEELQEEFVCVEFESLEDTLEFKDKMKNPVIISDSGWFDFEIEIYDSDRE